MSRKLTLYHKALLAWKGELEKQQQARLEDKLTTLRAGLHRKLEEMIGPEYVIKLEAEDDPDDMVLEAMVENFNFLGFRGPAGEINIILVMECPGCGRRMTSNPLTRLADLGRNYRSWRRAAGSVIINVKRAFDAKKGALEVDVVS
jgi:hypothetical protein